MAQGSDIETPEWFREAIATETRTFETVVDGIAIACRAWGEGPGRSIVLVHGGGANSRWWDHVAPLLARGRRVVALDLSGHGDSGWRDRYDVELWADEVLAVAALDEVGPDPIIAGHSLGGIVTLRAAGRKSAHLGGVVIVDASIVEFGDQDRRVASRMGSAAKRAYPTREVAESRFRPIPAQPTLPYVMQHIAANSIREQPDGWTWKFDPHVFDGSLTDSPPLAPLVYPAAVLRGEFGLIAGPAERLIRDGLGSDVPVVEIPAAGHHLMLDEPLALVTAIRTLVAEWDRPARQTF
jgi:pimeloyl-ACP methyl ester carboxylesterase